MTFVRCLVYKFVCTQPHYVMMCRQVVVAKESCAKVHCPKSHGTPQTNRTNCYVSRLGLTVYAAAKMQLGPDSRQRRRLHKLCNHVEILLNTQGAR